MRWSLASTPLAAVCGRRNRHLLLLKLSAWRSLESRSWGLRQICAGWVRFHLNFIDVVSHIISIACIAYASPWESGWATLKHLSVFDAYLSVRQGYSTSSRLHVWGLLCSWRDSVCIFCHVAFHSVLLDGVRLHLNLTWALQIWSRKLARFAFLRFWYILIIASLLQREIKWEDKISQCYLEK